MRGMFAGLLVLLAASAPALADDVLRADELQSEEMACPMGGALEERTEGLAMMVVRAAAAYQARYPDATAPLLAEIIAEALSDRSEPVYLKRCALAKVASGEAPMFEDVDLVIVAAVYLVAGSSFASTDTDSSSSGSSSLIGAGGGIAAGGDTLIVGGGATPAFDNGGGFGGGGSPDYKD